LPQRALRGLRSAHESRAVARRALTTVERELSPAVGGFAMASALLEGLLVKPTPHNEEGFTMSTLLTISNLDLANVAGGEGTFGDYTANQRQKIADPYRQVVCTTAGIKGGPDLATGMYGAGASDGDKIRAAEVLNKYCLGGAQLPAQAPKSPF
jgi:hypothetical protein